MKKTRAVAAILAACLLTSCSASDSDKDHNRQISFNSVIDEVHWFTYIEGESQLTFDVVPGENSFLEVECTAAEGFDPREFDSDLTVIMYKPEFGKNWSDCEIVASDDSSIRWNMQANYREDVALFICDFCLDISDIEQGNYKMVIVDEDDNVHARCDLETTKLEDADFFGLYDPQSPHAHDVRKPVIYLYPEEETDVTVGIDLDGEFTCTYPQIGSDGTWNVTASPDGTLYDHATGRNYDYIFWEGETYCDIDNFDQAICVAGSDTAEFLEMYLEAAGLNDSEIDDFISYWLPLMEGNAYNLISFPMEEYEQMAELSVSPAPDTVIRVYMVFTPLDEAVDIPEGCELPMPEPGERTGFTVVEWGGSMV